MLATLDTIVNSDYSIVYFHHGVNSGVRACMHGRAVHDVCAEQARHWLAQEGLQQL